MSIDIGGLEGRYVDWISHRRVHGGVDYVPQAGFVVLNGAPLAIPNLKEYQFMLLTGPEASNPLPV